MTARSLLAPVVGRVVRARARSWPTYSRLFAVGERTTWSVDEDARHLEATARRLGYDVAASRWARFATDQAVFLTSHFEALQPRWMQSTHRLATAYLHGRPGTPGYPEFDRAYDALRSAPDRFARIQVTHQEMRDLVLAAGVEPSAVHVIAIGIDIEHFPLGTSESRSAARAALDLPADAFVVGSFQKDGVGWGEGLEPKLVKGPDILVAALERVAAEIPELRVLLTGPARGYVRMELERRGIEHRHTVAQSRRELATAYHALDAYVVASRQEGGPKGVLESLATGVPLVSTRVGQVLTIVRDGETGLLVDVDDVEAIATAVLRLHDDSGLRESFRTPGRTTAGHYAYERLDPSWAGSSKDSSSDMLDRPRIARYTSAAVRWSRLLTRGSQSAGLRVFYGHDVIPAPGEAVAGGTAKFQRLATRFPNHPTDFSLLYLGSTWLPRDLRPLLRYARRRRIPLIVNQNGVGYPGWAGSGTEAFNRPLHRILRQADHVLYQSEFCKRAADECVCQTAGSWEVLHNAVDVEHFTPTEHPPSSGPVLLLGGDQYQAYRLELGLETLAALIPAHPDAQLLVTGHLATPVEPIVERLGLQGRVHALGRYSQAAAPGILRRAHVLLHTKVNDPCPSLVIEAMATGLPVVYARSGGVPELVAEEAGIGVPHPDRFERDEPPEAEELAEAVSRVIADLPVYADAARRRAVERFALTPWLDRHAEIFARLAPR